MARLTLRAVNGSPVGGTGNHEHGTEKQHDMGPAWQKSRL